MVMTIICEVEKIQESENSMKLFTGNALWALVKQSDAMSCLVLGLLLVMSIVCWTVAIYKFIVVRRKQQELEQAQQRLATVTNLEQLLAAGQAMAHTQAGAIITRALARTKELLGDERNQKGFSPLACELLRVELDAAVNDLMLQEEKHVSILKVSAEVAPLLGLFGTIWGLIHSFVRISEEQSADIITVAPGIAEALITTLVGLMVAIPALMLFHMISNRIAHMEYQLMTIAERCERMIHGSLVNR